MFYEAPHRLRELLDDLAEAMGEGRRAMVARELTKLHEELRVGLARGTARRIGPKRNRGASAP